MKELELIYAYQSLVALLSRSAGIRKMPHTEKISGPCFSLEGLEKKYRMIHWEIHNPVTISAVHESNSLLRAFRLYGIFKYVKPSTTYEFVELRNKITSRLEFCWTFHCCHFFQSIQLWSK